MIETVTFLDTETDSLDPTTGRIVEVAAVHWSVQSACVLSAFSLLVQAPSNSASSVNRIPTAALRYGVPLPDAINVLQSLVNRSGIAIAHNAQFDRSFIEAACPTFSAKWICSLTDLTFPVPSSSQSLIAIALAHDVGVVQAHRALADCFLLARLFERVTELGYDVPLMLAQGLRPKVEVQALVSYEDRDQAKSRKFRWNEDGTKRWLRRMPLEDIAALPFPCATFTVGTWDETQSTWLSSCRCEPSRARLFDAATTRVRCKTCQTRTERPAAPCLE